ncbi:MAG: PEP-CTERM sorting domain-containing protein [Methylophilaceae bacterium]|nr:PEP-CTERM sorting domain-containing protein [Methylophilaceae bacterium]
MFKHNLSMLGLAIGLTLASGAQATTITMSSFQNSPAQIATINGGGHSGAVYAGGFNAMLDGTEAFIAYCVDTAQSFNWGQVFSVTAVAANDKFGASKALAMGQLYTQHFGSISNATESAAFQVALWEIVNEASSNALSLTTGDFKVTPWNAAVTGLASNWLNSLGGAGDAYDLTVLTNSSYQDQLMATLSVNPLSTVPEPQTLALVLVGFIAMGAVVRRRKLPV